MKVDLHLFRKDITSSGGENGIIDKIFKTIRPSNKICVEFGANDVKIGSNVFTLWFSDSWYAILIEGDKSRYNKIVRDYEAYIDKHHINGSVDIINAYVSISGDNSLDNILSKKKIDPKFDLLIIDVDGTDYHIWKSLTNYRPRVVMIEYNPTIPPHISLLGKATGNRVGCGILNLFELGKEKGYDLVACTGVNAIFVIKQESHYFSNTNDLNKLFGRVDWSITYAMNTYDGGLFFSRNPRYGFNPISSEHMNIDNKEDFCIPEITINTLIANILKKISPLMYDFVRKIKNKVRRIK